MILNGYLNNFFKKQSSTSELNESERIVLFMVPFLGVHSVQIRNQVNKLFSSASLLLFKFVVFFDICKEDLPHSLKFKIAHCL